MMRKTRVVSSLAASIRVYSAKLLCVTLVVAVGEKRVCISFESV